MNRESNVRVVFRKPWSVPITLNCIALMFNGIHNPEAQVKEAGVAAVEHAEAVLARLHVHVGPGGAVDHGHVAEVLRHPEGMAAGPGRLLVDGRVDNMPPEPWCGKRNWPVASNIRSWITRGTSKAAWFPGRGIFKRHFHRVPDEVETRQPGVDVEAGAGHAVVVVPQAATRLGVEIVAGLHLGGEDAAGGVWSTSRASRRPGPPARRRRAGAPPPGSRGAPCPRAESDK